MSKINFAIVGCRRIIDLHAPRYFSNPNADIFAVCDTDKKRASDKALEWSVPPENIYTDYSTKRKRTYRFFKSI